MLVLSLILVTGLTVPPPTASNGPTGGQRIPLCRALESIRPGEILPVVVSGVYQVAYEAQEFFDPEEPTCNGRVQPATWVEFAPTVPTNRELKILLQRSRRAHVTFQGRLFGPGVVPPDDPSLPFAAAFARRISGRRYGHLDLFRTQLVVEAILEVGPMPAGVPWEWGGKPDSLPAVLSPQHLDVPKYPAAARKLGIAGEVVVDVDVVAGRVAATNVRAGDRVLAFDAVANIRTWQFDPGTYASFTTTFVYQLETRRAGDEQLRIELHLPYSVTITAPRYDW